ncbi:MAG: hypothetical protein R3B70_40585 [Polyangiaceae bacterium]
MAEAKAPVTPFDRLAAAFGATATVESREGATAQVFKLDRSPAALDICLLHGAPPVLQLRAHEEEPAPTSGHKHNVLARTRRRLLYPTLLVRKVTSLDRLNARFALRFEVRTGDPSFDDAVTVEADLSDEVLAQAFAAREARTAVRDLIASGMTVRFEERTVLAELPNPTDAHLTQQAVARAVESLVAIVTHVPRSDPSSFTARSQPGRILTAAILVIGIVGAGALAPGTLDDPGIPVRPLPRPLLALPFMLPGLAAGSLAFVLAYLLLRWQIKRRNTSTNLSLVLALFVVMATLGVGVADASNRLLDELPLATHEARVIAKETGTSRKSGTTSEWLLIVRSWHPGASEVELSVAPDLYRAVQVGEQLRITAHPGFFGWEWGAVAERAPGAPPPPPPSLAPERPRKKPRTADTPPADMPMEDP